MDAVLYAPGLGYYSAGLHKFGAQGDFVTAPELTPLFGRTLAHGLREAIECGVLELGAGSGALAASILESRPGATYRILELSAELEARQRERLSSFGVTWLRALPERIDGVVIANEVLDAIPCEVVRHAQGRDWQAMVAFEQGRLARELRWRPIERAEQAELAALAEARIPRLEGYTSELNPRAEALVRSICERFVDAVAVFIDYGFPRREYYHPDRSGGTLACHRGHQVHFDPLAAPGLEDITAHVDFTAMAEAAVEAGAEVVCYASQGRVLLALGLLEQIAEAETDALDARARTQMRSAVHRLTAPSEMGELFKVLIVGRGAMAHALADRLASVDQSHRL
ncbi:MAG: class I SAM-dependent methyltransferase [Casimicrobiaceae bacterium]